MQDGISQGMTRGGAVRGFIGYAVGRTRSGAMVRCATKRHEARDSVETIAVRIAVVEWVVPSRERAQGFDIRGKRRRREVLVPTPSTTANHNVSAKLPKRWCSPIESSHRPRAQPVLRG